MRVPIQNREKLERDVATKGIVNTDTDALSKYRRTKQRILEERQELSDLRKRLEKLESVVQKLNLEKQ